MNEMSQIKKGFGERGTSSQMETMQFFYSTGQTVWITKNDDRAATKGKIVQYVTLFPENQRTLLNTRLFFLPEDSGKLDTYLWEYITDIYCGEICRNTVDNMKKVVANALGSPQPRGATAALVKEVSENRRSYNDIFETLDHSCKTVLKSRVILELIGMGKFDEARALYQKMSIDKTTPSYRWEYFDFSFAILSLVKAGIITGGLEAEMQTRAIADPEADTFVSTRLGAVDYQRGIGFAIRETQPESMSELLQSGFISESNLERVRSLRQDPKIQELARKLDLHQMFDLNSL